MNFLRQSTAVDIALGPFVDATDGVTAETGLTISQADVRLKKNNGAWAQVNDNTAATHEENGWYEKELDATDTNTVGILIIAIHESGALPVWHEFQVLEEAVFDAMFAASAVGPLLANTTGTGLTAIPWNASWDAEVQSEVADALGVYDPPTNAEMEARTIVAANYATAANLATVAGYLDTEIASILEDTGTTLPAQIAALNNLSAADIRTAVGLASANLDTQLADLPTNAELSAALASADDAVLAAIAALNNLSQANVRSAVGLASANLDTQLGDLPTAAENAAALLAAVTEGTRTVVQTLRLLNAALGGKASGLETTTATYRDIDDTKDRIVATVDADGNRSALTLDLT